MANQIPNYPTFPGSSYTFYRLFFNPIGGGIYQLTSSRIAGNQPSSTDSGEIIVVLDWSQFADGDSGDTYQIASPVVSALQSTSFISELNGHALCEFPLHLVGHSRGGSLVSELSLRLGTNGIWVDHLTTLDPHPLNNDSFSDHIYSAVDAPVRTYENVLFHDNCWQDIALIHGEAVWGAYVRELHDLSGGYHNTSAFWPDHSNVHLWYHGTVDRRNPASDSEAQLTSAELATWYVPYENSGAKAGFTWSLIGRGDRTSSDHPEGSGYPAVRDGYNQTWDLGAGGAGNRTSLPSNNGTWPNIMKFNLVSANQAQQGSNISVKYFYQWAQPSTSTATISFYLDDDYNPLNSNGHLLQQITVPGNGAIYVSYQTVSLVLTSANAPAGSHSLYAKIAGGGKTRYLYAPEVLTIIPTLEVTSSSPSSGVAIAVAPADVSGLSDGVTPFSRTFNLNALVTLTAPGAASTNPFTRWQRDGTDWSTAQTITMTMDAGYTLTAVYADPGAPTIANVRCKTSSNGATISQNTWQLCDGPYFSWGLAAFSSAAVGYSFASDDQPDDAISTTAPYFQYPPGSLANGRHTFYVKGVDGSGRWGTAASFQIWIDREVPHDGGVSINTVGGTFIVGLSPWVTDNYSGVQWMRFSNDGSTWSTWEPYSASKGGWDLVAYGGNSADGPRSVYVTFEDGVGNESRTFSGTAEVNNVAAWGAREYFGFIEKDYVEYLPVSVPSGMGLTNAVAIAGGWNRDLVHLRLW
jgi:hypothetical protein